MIRWIRRLTLIGAGAALFLGSASLPWAAWNNLDDGKFRDQVNETALQLLRARGEPPAVIADLQPLKDKPFADRESFSRAFRDALPGEGV